MSVVGIGKRSRFTAMLACRISTHKRISPEGLGSTTTGETHEVGPLTISMMSSSTSSSVWYSVYHASGKEPA